MNNPIEVFISSTCYDLVDLRLEISQFLAAHGFEVRISEDPESAFYVDPLADSIESCLKNVEASDIVVAILDRRYGGILPEHSLYAGISATHAEVRRAREMHKPVRFFIREAALNDYHRLRSDSAATTKWVEPTNKQNRLLWKAFVDELFSLPAHSQNSNWYDPFRSVVDLKPLLVRRVIEHFPAYRGDLALRSDRYVRLAFIFQSATWDTINGYFRNIGVGPALNLRHGVCQGKVVLKEYHLGGLPERDPLTIGNSGAFSYVGSPGLQMVGATIFCEYSNRFGDRYRLEVPVTGNAGSNGPTGVGPDSLFVWRQSEPDGSWARAS